LSAITAVSYASTKEKKAMCQSFVFGSLTIVLMFVEFGFAIAFFGGGVLIGTLVWLGIIVKSTNDTLGYDIPNR